MLLSLIVPFSNSERYLAEALEPLLPMLHAGKLQLVLVDNGSTDGSRRLLDQLLPDGGHVLIIECDQSGPGSARNAGLAVATGAYLAFLDSDDVVDPDRLLSLCHRMQSLDADLAVFNHARLYPDGTLRANLRSDLLLRKTPVENEASRLELLDNFNVAWNKVYRRSLVDRFSLRFPEGIYEDVPWSISCLFAARRVITEPQVIYTYRQHPASTLRGAGAQHQVLVAQYQRALEFCVEQGCSRSWVEALAVRAVEHGLLIAYKRKRLGLFGRIRLVADLAALVRQSDARHVIQATSRLDRLQKWALRHESAAPLEARHLLRAVARRVVRLRVWSGS